MQDRIFYAYQYSHMIYLSIMNNESRVISWIFGVILLLLSINALNTYQNTREHSVLFATTSTALLSPAIDVSTLHNSETANNANEKCNIAIVPIQGEIGFFGKIPTDTQLADADIIIASVHNAESASGIMGILIRIDSPGGSPVAGRLLSDTLKRSKLPVAAVIRSQGTSGAYFVATGAGIIIADPMSDVGDIGVTMSYVDNVKQNQNKGLNFVSLVSAHYKDYGNPNTTLTQEERMLLERDLKMNHHEFVKAVAENRKLPIEEIDKLADGSSLPGTLALKYKLIDALGDQESARAWFSEKLQIPVADVKYCEEEKP